jgi:hypothetical protein
VKTRRTAPTGPEDSLGASERVAWLVIDIETGSTVGKITRVSTLPGHTDYWQAYGIDEAPYGEPPLLPVRLGASRICAEAQEDIEQWHTEREDAARKQALAEIQEER